MPPGRPTCEIRPKAGPTALIVLLLAGLLACGGRSPAGVASRPPPEAVPVTAPEVRPARLGDEVGPPGLPIAHDASAPPPSRLRIPMIGVDAELGRVGLRADGTIQVPGDWDQPAWYQDGPAPGAQGPAVIVGHLDSDTGPAVFWNLAKLAPGALVTVTRSDGSAVTFQVRRTVSYPRASFPTAAVYGATSRSELRLITCAGTFDAADRRYSENVVVFAGATATAWA